MEYMVMAWNTLYSKLIQCTPNDDVPPCFDVSLLAIKTPQLPNIRCFVL